MSSVFIHEVFDAGLLVRFMGTELVQRWRHDNTGKFFGANLDQLRRDRLIFIGHSIVNQPCGVLQQGVLATSAGREAAFEAILLPLSADTPYPQRIAVFSTVLDTLEREEHSSRFVGVGLRDWIDLGAGVPGAMPPPI